MAADQAAQQAAWMAAYGQDPQAVAAYQQYYYQQQAAAAANAGTATTAQAYPQMYSGGYVNAYQQQAVAAQMAQNPWATAATTSYYPTGTTTGYPQTTTQPTSSTTVSSNASKYPAIPVNASNAPWKKNTASTPYPSSTPSYASVATSGSGYGSAVDNAPQYVPVQSRTTTGVSSNTLQQQAGEQKEKFPPGLRTYVADALAKCAPANREYAEQYIRDFLVQAVKAGNMWQKDWSKEPMPEFTKPDFAPPRRSTPTTTFVAAKLASPKPTTKKRKNPVDYDSDEDSSPSKLNKLRNDEQAKREARARRFDSDSPAPSMTPPAVAKKSINSRLKEMEPNADVIDWDKHTIVGTSTALEKPYLRLTSAPDPANVRPLEICRQTLKLLKRKWKEEQNYPYICDQFKSLRQDLTVQRIRNAFTIEVYETHARIALEKGDLGEFNQCQSQLKHLYKEVKGAGHENEFKAYRVLYCLHTLNRRDINNLLQDLTVEDRKDPMISHALAVRKAVAHRDYHQLFKLYRNYPQNMSPYLIDHFVERERISALRIMCVAYKSSQLHVAFVAEELGWIGPTGVDDCVKQLEEWKIPLQPVPLAADDMELDNNGGATSLKIDTKEGARIVNGLWSKFKTVDIKGQV